MVTTAKKFTAFDLFCGAGGSSWGARMAGAEIVGGVDMDETAIATFRDNFPAAKYAIASKAEDVNLRHLKRTIGRLDVLLASPECTDHTHAKGSAPRSEASRRKALMVRDYAEVLKPKWIVIENVVNFENWAGFDRFESGITDLGFTSQDYKLNSADFGVPQARRRLFIVFSKNGKPPSEIKPRRKTVQIARDFIDLGDTYKWTLLRQPKRAPATLERAERAISQLGDDAPFLIVYYGTDHAGGWQSLDRPLRTLTTLDRFAVVRPTASGHVMRMLQVPELERAMGFTRKVGGRHFRLNKGTRRDKVRMLGNAVCPPVMESVVKSLALGI